MNSRSLQNIQHIISGVNSFVSPSNAGIFALFAIGKVSLFYPLITFAITFVLTRLSSELQYQTTKKLLEEK